MLSSLAVAFLCLQSSHVANTPVPRMDQKFWVDRNAILTERATQGPVEVAFVGDSITQGWESTGRTVFESEFSGYKTANFGIGADSTQHVLWRVDQGQVVNVQPKVIVMLIGTNNIGNRDQTAEMIAEGIQAILDRLVKNTKAKILLHAIFPRDVQPDGYNRTKVNEVNAITKSFTDGKRVIWKDFNSVFLHDDQTMRLIMMPDKVHLSRAGYRLWAMNIRDDIKLALAE